MNTDPKKPIGFRKPEPFLNDTIPWRFWIGPLLVARTPGYGIGVKVSWTR